MRVLEFEYFAKMDPLARLVRAHGDMCKIIKFTYGLDRPSWEEHLRKRLFVMGKISASDLRSESFRSLLARNPTWVTEVEEHEKENLVILALWYGFSCREAGVPAPSSPGQLGLKAELVADALISAIRGVETPESMRERVEMLRRLLSTDDGEDILAGINWVHEQFPLKSENGVIVLRSGSETSVHGSTDRSPTLQRSLIPEHSQGHMIDEENRDRVSRSATQRRRGEAAPPGYIRLDDASKRYGKSKSTLHRWTSGWSPPDRDKDGSGNVILGTARLEKLLRERHVIPES